MVDKGKVISVSREAFVAGVRVGMRPGGVSAVSPATTILERDLQREEIMLNAVALALLQFTPEVAHAADFSILMDVTASLRLFRGRAAIGREIRHSTQALGVTVRLGTAPTATGAWLLARLQIVKREVLIRRTVKPISLERQLDRISLRSECCPAYRARLSSFPSSAESDSNWATSLMRMRQRMP